MDPLFQGVEHITLSNKHIKLRTVAFVVALLVAVGAFAFGISRMGHKEPGWYEIGVDPNDAAPRYANGIKLIYGFEGSSDDIKKEMMAVKDAYSTVLLRSYQLLDAEETYDGLVNLASLNRSLGQPQQVGGELLWVLRDLWSRTQAGQGVNLFAGALCAEWDSILSMDDISEFDPAVNPDTARRIHALAAKTADLSNFSLTAGDSGQVTVTVSQSYLDFLAENEYGAAVLTAGRMADAYRLAMIRDVLEEAGYTRGYLTTDSGLTLSLSGHMDGRFLLYGLDGAEAVQCASVTARTGSACSYLRVFPMTDGEAMYHAIPDSGETRYCHPNFDMNTGDFPGIFTASCVVKEDGDIVDACARNLALYTLQSADEAGSISQGAVVAYALQGRQGTIYTNVPDLVNGEEGNTVTTF